MQKQKQQAAYTSPPRQKPIHKAFLLFRIVCFTVTLLLLVLTGIFFLKNGVTSPSTLWSSLFTIIVAFFSFLQLIPIIFPRRSEPAAIVHHYSITASEAHTHPPLSPSPVEPIFRFNMSLKDPNEFYGRIRVRNALISRTANKGSSSIVGGRRIGKTWLIEYLQLVAPTHRDLGPRFRVGYLSATHPQCQTLTGFVIKALEVLKIPHHHLDQSLPPLGQLAKAIGDLKAQDIVPVLCIDEFEGFDNRQEFNQNFVEGLRAMAQDDSLVLVTASKRPLAEVITDLIGGTSPLFNIIKQITLKPFTETEAETFVQEKSIQVGFDDQERAYLMKCAATYGLDGEKQWFPLRLQLVGQMLLEDKQAPQREPERYRLNDGRYQLDFEKRLIEEYEAVVRHT